MRFPKPSRSGTFLDSPYLFHSHLQKVYALLICDLNTSNCQVLRSEPGHQETIRKRRGLWLERSALYSTEDREPNGKISDRSKAG